MSSVNCPYCGKALEEIGIPFWPCPHCTELMAVDANNPTEPRKLWEIEYTLKPVDIVKELKTYANKTHCSNKPSSDNDSR
jgi:glutaredoxin